MFICMKCVRIWKPGWTQSLLLNFTVWNNNLMFLKEVSDAVTPLDCLYVFFPHVLSALWMVKCRAQILGMGHHTWSYVTPLSLYRTILGRDTAIWKSGIWGCKKNRNIEKNTFRVVQMKFLAMHITNQKWSFDTVMVRNVQNILMEHDLYLIS